MHRENTIKSISFRHRGIHSLEKSIAFLSFFGEEYDQEYDVGSLEIFSKLVFS